MSNPPFDIAMGMPIFELQVERELKNSQFLVTPVKSHSAFDQYIVTCMAGYGVSRINGIGPTLENDDYGNQATARFESVSRQLSAKYGKPKTFDFLNYGSIWNEPREWSKAISRNERTYAHSWSKDANQLTNNLTSVFLSVSAIDLGTYLTLIYEYENHADVIRQAELVEAEAL